MRRDLRTTGGFAVPLALLLAVAALVLWRGGGGPLPIVPLTADGPAVSNQFPVACPDGRSFLFQRCESPAVTRSADGRTLYHFKEDESNWDLFRIGADGQGLVRLTDGPAIEDEPAPSPDGQTIAYRRFTQARSSI